MLLQDRGDATVALGLAAVLIIIWASLYNIRGPDLFYEPQPSLELQAGDDSIFLHHAISIEFPSPIDYTPIHSVCTTHLSNFRPGLLFSCEDQHGGVGMVRNQILKCIRYAMHGGGALVIPSMAKRNPKDISDIETSNDAPLEYLFDREIFIEHLTRACPGMRLYNHAKDFPSYENRAGQPLALVGDQFEPNHPRTGLSDPLSWRASFDSWLNDQGKVINPSEPIHVQIGQAYLEYPVHKDTLAFASEFGKILSFRSDARALAARVLLQMQQQFSLPIDPGKAINDNAFFGAHLRLEKDAVEAWSPEEGWTFSAMERQFEEVVKEVVRSGMRVVYVACGDQGIVERFDEYLSKRLKEVGGGERNITVVTKGTLLPPLDLARLEKMSFDQQALVDFLIMFKASFFIGVAHSSFPWTVALRRHELSMFREGYANLGSDLLRDEFSVIMGMRSDYPYVDPFEWGLWP
ncbi:hypothetical protein BKA65DRAFT_394876 [Rhexocercosporidium sp. MPI-PUGE-AT-0058]|nr:hypothetical protein BKA65DRAFT_394876 [Rhexocercosporidium sp. MPI-PUGE-AT-0058]